MKSTTLTSPVSILPFLRGADGDEDGAEAGGSGEGGSSTASEEDEANKGKAGDGETPEQLRARIANLEEEKNRHWSKAEAEKKRADDAAAEIKRRDDESKSAEQLEKEQFEEIKTTVTALETQNRDLQVQLAFLTSNTVQWHDSEAALRLADLSSVEIDKDGKVTGLKEALDAVAKQHPFLVKPKEEDDDSKKTQPSPTGQPPQRQRQDAVTDRAKLRNKYPALRNRS